MTEFRRQQQMVPKSGNPLLTNPEVQKEFMKNKSMQKQDLRMDLPTIGIQTIRDCKKYGLKGIVLKSKKNIFLDKSKSIEFADKNKIFILIK